MYRTCIIDLSGVEGSEHFNHAQAIAINAMAKNVSLVYVGKPPQGFPMLPGRCEVIESDSLEDALKEMLRVINGHIQRWAKDGSIPVSDVRLRTTLKDTVVVSMHADRLKPCAALLSGQRSVLVNLNRYQVGTHP